MFYSILVIKIIFYCKQYGEQEEQLLFKLSG
jgi:hypothetical protein